MRRQLIRFSLVGAAGFVVDASVLYLALHAGTGYYVGRLLSFVAAVFATWQLNRHFTFGVANAASASRPDPGQNGRSSSIVREGGKYLIAMCGGGAVNYAVYCVCVALLPHFALLPVAAVAAGSLAGLAVNFALAHRWVYRPSC
jgi:putative flippase GtrA